MKERSAAGGIVIAQMDLSMRRPKKNIRIFAKIRSALSKLNPPVPTTRPNPVVASVQSPWTKLQMLQGRRSGPSVNWPRYRVAQTRLLAGSKTDVLNMLVLDAEEHMWAAQKDEAEGEVRKTGIQTF